MADKTLEDIFSDAAKGGGGGNSDGPDYDSEADNFLRGIYSGEGFEDPKKPGRQIYVGGISNGQQRLSGAQGVSYIQKMLIKAGLLDPEDITHPGSAGDNATRSAMSAARDAQATLGTTSFLETIEVLSSNFMGWDKIKAAKSSSPKAPEPAYVPPPRQQMSEKDIASVVRATAMELTGMEAGEADINEVLLKFRAAEEQEYQSSLTQDRQQFDASDGGPDRAPTTVKQAPSASSLAEEHFLQSDEGLEWSVGKGILGLINTLRSGG